MNAKDILRNLLPTFALSWNRKRKKVQLRKQLEAKRAAGSIWTAPKLVSAFKEAGIDPKKDLLVHSSLSKIGYVEGGASTVVNALLEFLQPSSTLLMPTSPVVTLQAEHHLDIYDVATTRQKWVQSQNSLGQILPCTEVHTHWNQLRHLVQGQRNILHYTILMLQHMA